MTKTHAQIDQQRFPTLDGFRAISILLVLGCHMLPLGPKAWHLNYSAGLLGMTLFFTLSGFLITLGLYRLHEVRVFLIRRLFRIVPAYLLVVTIALLIDRASAQQWVAYILFRVNYGFTLLSGTGPLWSLCVEMHFYLGIAALMLLTRFRGFFVLPLAFVALTACRWHFNWGNTISTHVRINELLGGASLAFAYASQNRKLDKFLTMIPWWICAFLLIASSHPATGDFQYLRPVFASLLVGQSILRPDAAAFAWLKLSPLRYIAEISYALYLVHSLTMMGWLGSGNTMVKYAKRPICIALSFLAADLSTRYFESYWIRVGRSLARKTNGEPTRPEPSQFEPDPLTQQLPAGALP